MAWKSKEEINKVFADHIDSLRVSNLPFDEDAVRHQWSQALEAFDIEHSTLEGED